MPPPRGSQNDLEGPGDYDVTSVVHSDTYPAIDPAKLNMTNKSVFITGASRGLGRAIAVSFAKAGASFIAIGGRSDFTETTEAIQWGAASAGRPAPVVMPLMFEMTDPAGVEEAAVKVRKAFGRVDIVVNNAGLFGTLGKVVDSDQENFRQVIDTNIYGPYLVARAFIPLMLESGGDRTLLTISSVAAHLVLPGLASYQISKLGVLRLTQLLNAEYADQGFLAYAVHPGNVKTDMTGTMENGPPSASIAFTDSADLAGDSVAYLASQRRDWLAGRYVNLTWDLPELEAKKDEIVKGDKLKLKFDF